MSCVHSDDMQNKQPLYTCMHIYLVMLVARVTYAPQVVELAAGCEWGVPSCQAWHVLQCTDSLVAAANVCEHQASARAASSLVG
jgi:hypothetical protein